MKTCLELAKESEKESERQKTLTLPNYTVGLSPGLIAQNRLITTVHLASFTIARYNFLIDAQGVTLAGGIEIDFGQGIQQLAGFVFLTMEIFHDIR